MATFDAFDPSASCVWKPGYYGAVSFTATLTSTPVGGDVALYVYPAVGPPVDVDYITPTQGVPFSYSNDTLSDGDYNIVLEYDSEQTFYPFTILCNGDVTPDPPSESTWTLAQSQSCETGGGTVSIEVTRDAAGADTVFLELVGYGLTVGGVVVYGTPRTFSFTGLDDGTYDVHFTDSYTADSTTVFIVECATDPPPSGASCDPFFFTQRWTTLGPLLLADPIAAADELERHDQELEQHFDDCGCQAFNYTYRWATFVHAILAGANRAVDVMEQRDLELEEAVAHDPGCELRLTHRWREIAPLVVAGDARAWDLLEMRDREIEEARSGCSCGCASMTFSSGAITFPGWTAGVGSTEATTITNWTVTGEFVDDGMGPWSIEIEVYVNAVLVETWTFGPFASPTFGPVLVDVADVVLADGDSLSLALGVDPVDTDIVSFEMTTDYPGCVEGPFSAPS